MDWEPGKLVSVVSCTVLVESGAALSLGVKRRYLPGFALFDGRLSVLLCASADVADVAERAAVFHARATGSNRKWLTRGAVCTDGVTEERLRVDWDPSVRKEAICGGIYSS